MVGCLPHLQAASDKPTSLLHYRINSGGKKFYIAGPSASFFVIKNILI
jgi:hypothetical protein